MRLQLKDFQSDAVERLVAQLRLAAREATVTEQAVVLSSPTGSGKTIIATAAIERILEGDEQQAPEREARFLWLSDQPELNEQTLRKMRETSSTLSAARLTLIDSTFDEECLAAGRVYFLNTQKLGRDRQLVTRGDIRKYTIWETLQNTATRFPQSFFVFLDEAHRGMTNAREQREAATLVQKFIKGSPEEMAPVPTQRARTGPPSRKARTRSRRTRRRRRCGMLWRRSMRRREAVGEPLQSWMAGSGTRRRRPTTTGSSGRGERMPRTGDGKCARRIRKLKDTR